MKPTSSTKMPVTFSDAGDDAPNLTQGNFDSAKLRVAGRDVNRADWQVSVRARVGKQRINIMLDAPIVEHFKALAGRPGHAHHRQLPKRYRPVLGATPLRQGRYRYTGRVQCTST